MGKKCRITDIKYEYADGVEAMESMEDTKGTEDMKDTKDTKDTEETKETKDTEDMEGREELLRKLRSAIRREIGAEAEKIFAEESHAEETITAEAEAESRGDITPYPAGTVTETEAPESAPDLLWKVLLQYQKEPFYTVKGLEFTYYIKGNELFVSRKDKSITRASVEVALQKAINLNLVVSGPKKLTSFGASYLYPIFLKIGIIRTEP